MSEHGQVASDFATQGIWMETGKLGTRVVDADRSRPPGRKILGEVNGERKPVTKWRKNGMILDQIRKSDASLSDAVPQPLDLAMADEACRKAEM